MVFTPWYEINHVQKQREERQRFPISAAKGNTARKQQYTHYKLRILENHGREDGRNFFYEFALFGEKGDAMRSYLKQHGMYQLAKYHFCGVSDFHLPDPFCTFLTARIFRESHSHLQSLQLVQH